MDDPVESPDKAAIRALYDRAYATFDNGDLHQASALFGELTVHRPNVAYLHYMRGLAHKYLRDWPASLEHNLRAQQVEEEFDEASAWNAGIAATAMGDWAEARRQWAQCGITIPEGDGPIESDFGMVAVRLNPWGTGETVYARRIDVVRARLLNVPLPESGHRLFDIVLHDGAKTGERVSGDRTYPVFNVLQTLQRSDHRTYVAFVQCPTVEDKEALEAAELPGIGFVEDWTHSIRHLCLRCSYGVAHLQEHPKGDADAGNDDWQAERQLGIGAQGKAAVERLLADWVAAGPGRRVDAIESREVEAEGPAEGSVWWRGFEDEDDDDQDQDQDQNQK
ncbi:hypothetical protein [Stenotrophomonas sp. PD6]|uniref:hypothetical protein n=1 Tax=Stenotrophomonas sp. PD6 TaxID=3368612 RepID=UPI003B9FB404